LVGYRKPQSFVGWKDVTTVKQVQRRCAAVRYVEFMAHGSVLANNSLWAMYVSIYRGTQCTCRKNNCCFNAVFIVGHSAHVVKTTVALMLYLSWDTVHMS